MISFVSFPCIEVARKRIGQQLRQEAAGFVWDKKQEDVKILAALSYVLLGYCVVLSESP